MARDGSAWHWRGFLRPVWRDPIFWFAAVVSLLLIALQGLFDVGEAATAELDWIRDLTDATPLAEIDPEGFFDFTETRPTVRHVDGVRQIDWPVTEALACRTEGPRDLVVVSAIERTHPPIRRPWSSTRTIVPTPTRVDRSSGTR